MEVPINFNIDSNRIYTNYMNDYKKYHLCNDDPLYSKLYQIGALLEIENMNKKIDNKSLNEYLNYLILNILDKAKYNNRYDTYKELLLLSKGFFNFVYNKIQSGIDIKKSNNEQIKQFNLDIITELQKLNITSNFDIERIKELYEFIKNYNILVKEYNKNIDIDNELKKEITNIIDEDNLKLIKELVGNVVYDNIITKTKTIYYNINKLFSVDYIEFFHNNFDNINDIDVLNTKFINDRYKSESKENNINQIFYFIINNNCIDFLKKSKIEFLTNIYTIL
jgi:hypothetical protein